MTYGNKKIRKTKTRINNDRAAFRSRLIRKSLIFIVFSFSLISVDLNKDGIERYEELSLLELTFNLKKILFTFSEEEEEEKT